MSTSSHNVVRPLSNSSDNNNNLNNNNNNRHSDNLNNNIHSNNIHQAIIRRPSNSMTSLNHIDSPRCMSPNPPLSSAVSLPVDAEELDTFETSSLLTHPVAAVGGPGGGATGGATIGSAPTISAHQRHGSGHQAVIIPLSRRKDVSNSAKTPAIGVRRKSHRNSVHRDSHCEVLSKNLVSPTTYKDPDSDEFEDQLTEETPLNARTSATEERACLIGIDANIFIRMCVGYKSYVLRKSNVYERAPDSLLAKFCHDQHEERLTKCQGFFPDTNEYLFERSPRLFEAVYKYFITGNLHRPMDACLQEYIEELAYWGIPNDFLKACCMPSLMENDLKNEQKVDPFLGLRCAGIRSKLWAITEGDGSLKSKLFSVLSIGLVMVSVSALVISSLRDFQVQEYSPTKPDEFSWEPHPYFYYLESACIAWFTIEYIFRLVIAPNKWNFMTEVLNVVDFLAVMPFYLELTLQICGIDSEDLKNFKFALVMVRLLRSLRVMRILKVSRYSVGMRIFALTIKSSASQLAMIVMVFSIGVIFFATLVYFMEKDEPDSPFTSIPVGFWWCIVTMTTVGYGDIVPLTTIGKIVGTAAIVSGVLVLALPITIMVDNFMKVAGK